MRRKHRPITTSKKKPYILLMILSTLFIASGQLLFSHAYSTPSSLIFSLLPVNIFSLSAILAYGLGAILFVLAIGKGAVSSVYPLSSLSYVWATLGAILLLHEHASIQKLSILLILGGIVLITRE